MVVYGGIKNTALDKIITEKIESSGMKKMPFGIQVPIQYLQSNDKLMPNSCLGQNLLVNHHGIAVSRNSCLSHAQILKHHGIAYV